MGKSALSVHITIILLLLTGLSSISMSSDLDNNGIGLDQPSEGWWNSWNRDLNHNNIDDVLDEMILDNPGSTRTDVFIDYFRKTTDVDVKLVSAFDLEVKYVFHIVNTICARNVLLSDIPAMAKLPGVVMIEYEDEVITFNDVGAKAVKARNSTEYSPNTVWDMDIFGRYISIAILDSGVDDGPSPAPPPYHLSLDDLDDDLMTIDDPKFIAGVDFTRSVYLTDGSYNPDDGFLGHGTHVAATAMGTGGGSEYMGVAPQARLVDVKVMENWGSGAMGAVVNGIEWVTDHKDEFNIRVMSMSIGGNYNSNGGDTASQAVNNAVDAGLVAVVAIGNGGSNMIGPPAAADKALVVGALNDHNTVDRTDDNVWGSSNVGPRSDDGDEDHSDEMKPDVLAPGVNIMSAKSDTTSTHIQFSGTSMATPHVAGVVALMLEANPDLTPQEVKDIIHMTSEMPAEIEPSTEYDDVYNYAYGWGFVDAYKAVKMALADDFNPPIISDIEVDVSGNTAVISWETDKLSNSIIDYGTTTALGTQKDDLDNYVTSHTMTLTDLELDTDYYYNILAYDENGAGPGESGISGPFHTDNQLDVTPPNILEGPKVLEPILDTSATIYWRTNEDSDSYVEYGLTMSYGEFAQSSVLEKDHTIILTNLEPETVYHYRVRSADASGNIKNSTDNVFKTASEKEQIQITSGPIVKDLAHDSATIYWETGSIDSTSLVRYGTKVDDLPYEKYEPALDTFHSIKLTGLNETTKYYYYIESTNDEYLPVSAGDDTTYFVTLKTPDTTKPVISDVQLTMLTDTSATFEWTTDEPATSYVDYGQGNPGPSFGGFDDLVTSHNVTISDLSPSTKYYYQVRSADISGNEESSAKDTFVTKPLVDVIAPEILTGPSVLAIGETSATIVWTTDESSDSVVNFGTTTAYGLTASDQKMVRSHQVILTDLDHSTTYFFKVTSTDDNGNTVESEDSTLKTLDIISPIKIEFLNLNSGDTLSGIVTIEGSVSGGTGGIQSVRYKIDDNEWDNLGSGGQFSILLDTTKYSEGTHTMTVEAKVGEMLMQEDATFVIQRTDDDSKENFLLILLLAAAIVMVFVMIMAAYSSKRRRKVIPSDPHYADFSQGGEPSFFEPDAIPQEALGIGFIPDPEEPAELSFVPDAGFIPDEPEVSFTPEPAFVPDGPEVSFIPDPEPVLFDISQAGTQAHLETVRCPRCKSMFDADISGDIYCPRCGFSASLKR